HHNISPFLSSNLIECLTRSTPYSSPLASRQNRFGSSSLSGAQRCWLRGCTYLPNHKDHAFPCVVSTSSITVGNRRISPLENCWCNGELVLKNSLRRRVFPQGSFFRFVFFFW